MVLNLADEPSLFPPDQYRRLLLFNFFPLLDMDASWWEPLDWLPSALHDWQPLNQRAQFYVAQAFLRQHELEGEFDFDFRSSEKQVAFFTAEELTRLVYLQGLTLQSRRLASVILNQERQTVKGAIGEEDYVFAIKQGTRQLADAQFQHALPQPDQGEFEHLVPACYQLGMQSLATVMCDLPNAFVKRLQFKLAKPLTTQYWQALAQDRQAHLKLLLKLARQLG